MTVIALASAKGSPGVTTTALALAWAWPEAAAGRCVLVVDADMAGGDIASGYLQGAVPAERGLLSLAAEHATDLRDRLWDHLVSLDGDQTRVVLTGITDRSQARSLAPQWSSLAEALVGLADAEPPVDVLVDLGRLGTIGEATPLLERADLLLLGLRSNLTGAAATRSVVSGLAQAHGDSYAHSRHVAAVVIGAGRPYSVSEIADAIDAPVVTSIAWDPVNAEVLSAGRPGGWRFSRSALMRSAGGAARDLLGYLATAAGTPSNNEPNLHAAVGSGGRWRDG